MRRVMAVVMAGALLGGCAGRYLPLYVAQAPTLAQTTQTRIVATLTDLSNRAEALNHTYQRASREADLSQIPLIGAAVALGLVALNKPDNAAKTLGRIGIGVGAYTTARSMFSPSDGPEVLRRGVDAINCIVANGSSLVGATYDQDIFELRAAAKDLAGLAATLRANADRIVVPAKPEEAKTLEAARTAAKLAAAATEPALNAASEQLGAYQRAPTELNTAASTIFTVLAAKTSVRVAIDPADLAKSWAAAAPIAPDAGGGGQGAGAVTARGLADTLQGDTAEAIRLTAVLAASAAALPFSDSLQEAVKCPARI